MIPWAAIIADQLPDPARLPIPRKDGDRVVDHAAFDAIECNRCGECCTNFRLQPNDGERGELWWNYAGPLGMLENAAYWIAHGHAEGWSMALEGDTDSLMWIGQLTPRFDGEQWWYSCGFFARDDDGLGRCTVHDRRPSMCSRFPYGRPTKYDECSWNVELVDFDVAEGVAV